MAITDPNFPHVRTPLLNSDGTTSRPYYIWFQKVSTQLLQDASAIAALQQGAEDGHGNVMGTLSVLSEGALPGIVTVSLQNDAAAPGHHYHYGTDGSGAKGWYSAFSDFEASTEIAPVSNGDGTVSFALQTTSIIAGTYGDATHAAWFTVDSKGRLTNAGVTPIPSAVVHEILVADGISPPVMLTDEAQTDFLYSD